MTCVRTPDPLEELEAHPLGTETGKADDEASWVARLVGEVASLVGPSGRS